MVLILFLVFKSIVTAIGNQKNLLAERVSQIFKISGKLRKQRQELEKLKKDN